MATRFKSNSLVWFDIFNEPGPYQDQWLTEHRTIISLIRDEVGAQNIIVVEGANYGQDYTGGGTDRVNPSNSAILSHGAEILSFGGKTYTNIAFSAHIYRTSLAVDKLGNYFDQVNAKGFAFLVGEFGIQNNTDNTFPGVQSVYATAPQRALGRLVWAWWGGDQNDLTTSGNGGGQNLDNCTNPGNLSDFGKLVWADTH